jgi:hypothetical protein
MRGSDTEEEEFDEEESKDESEECNTISGDRDPVDSDDDSEPPEPKTEPLDKPVLPEIESIKELSMEEESGHTEVDDVDEVVQTPKKSAVVKKIVSKKAGAKK